MIVIRKDNPTKVTANFTEAELHNASYGYNGGSFGMDERVINAAQIIRDYFGVPATVNSTRRTKAHELLQGRSGDSQHVYGFAIDLDFPEEILLRYHQEILLKGNLYHQLRVAGITGFGLYDGFLHIDTRTNGIYSDEYGKFTDWDKRVTTKKKA